MNNRLKRYLKSCDATAKDLSEISGLSSATISRYLNGTRIPDIDGANMLKLSEGVFKLLEERTEDNRITQGEVLQQLKDAIISRKPEMIMGLKTDHLNRLIMEMNISKARFAEELFYSPSAMTRILSGENKPRNINKFVSQTADLACKIQMEEGNFQAMKAFLARETGSEPKDIDEAHSVIERWLLGIIEDEQQNATAVLLGKIDEFDYESYISEADIEAVERIPMTNLKIPVSKTFTGQKGLEEGITAFLKSTVTSASMEPVFVFSDHPMEQLSKNPETIEKWKKAIGAAILQGKQVQILHNVDRPYEEMLIGVENWMPLYMTGNVKSYYSDAPHNRLFNHILMVSGSAVLSGFAAGGMNGQYLFSKSTPRVAEGRKNAEILLSDSKSLVEVFQEDGNSNITDYLNEDSNVPGERISYSDDLPIYLVSEALIDKVLTSSKTSVETAKAVKQYVANQRKIVERIAEHSSITEIIMTGGRGEKQLSDSRIIAGVHLRYREEDYREHMRLAREFAENNDNFKLIEVDASPYKNIRINVHSPRHAIITRNTNNRLYLMVRHRRLVESIERELKNILNDNR